MRRILSVWLPDWPITRLRRAGPPRGDLLVTLGDRLEAVSPEAAAQGLRPGQSLAEARAICPRVCVVPADPQEDARALTALAAWCERFTPLAAADPPDGLWLDLTGCAHLFGGEDGLVAALVARLSGAGIACRTAVAAATGAAWAMARSDGFQGPALGGVQGQRPWPFLLAYLRLDPGVVSGLHRLGLRTVADLARVPRAELAARFGHNLLLRLDQATGAAQDPIAWPRAPASWREALAFAEPIGTPEDLARGLAVLAGRLEVLLEAGGMGGLEFAADFFRLDLAVPRIAVTTAQPVRDAAWLGRLLVAKLGGIDPGFGIEAMVLEAQRVGAMVPVQPGLADGPADSGLACVVDELVNRLGRERVWRPAPRASFVPERGVARVAALSAAPAWSSDPTQPRPIRLLRRPEPIEATAMVPDAPPVQFRWRRALHRVRAASGPERIAAEWWRSRSAADRSEADLIRDYYRVEDMAGARFWIFRAGLAGTPRWFLHGLFA